MFEGFRYLGVVITNGLQAVRDLLFPGSWLQAQIKADSSLRS
jgi:hypothetical protein